MKTSSTSLIILAVLTAFMINFAAAEEADKPVSENKQNAGESAAKPDESNAKPEETKTGELLFEQKLGVENRVVGVDGLSLDILYGAIAKPTEARIIKDPTPEKWGSFIRTSPAFLIEPVDVEFKKPVRASLRYDDRIIPPGKIEKDLVVMYSTDGIEWLSLGGDALADENTIEVKIPGFGYFAVAAMIGKNPPSADFEYHPADPTAGSEIRFTQKCSDPDGDFVSFTWDFNSDGKADSTDPEVYYTFGEAGDFPVELTCTDGIGTNNKVISLEVRSLTFRDYVDIFLELLIEGGDFVLYILFISGILIVVFIIERTIYFYISNRFNYEQASIEMRDALATGGVTKGWEALSKYDVPETAILADAFKYAETYSPESISDIIAGSVAAWRKKLDKRLTFLGTLGNNAPFIGLFGTVLGIIKAFAELKGGTISPQAIQGEIGEALRATAVGLLVAIPAVISFNIFSKRVGGIRQNVDALGSILIAHLKEFGSGPAVKKDNN